MFETEIYLCSDCSYRAKGPKKHSPKEDKYYCEWCGSEISGTINVVEEQENPGELQWEKDRDALKGFLEESKTFKHISEFNQTIDFTVGNRDLWPRSSNDEHLNTICGSSIEFDPYPIEDTTVKSLRLHLPPTKESLKSEIDNTIIECEAISKYYGTGALGGIPAPEGVIMPHITSEEISFNSVIKQLKNIENLYKYTYQDGEEILKQKP